jgi:hypothetical protein
LKGELCTKKNVMTVLPENLYEIPYPARLKAGQRIVRCWKGGERVYEEFRIVKWIAPLRPVRGQPWTAGFIRCVCEETGERREFGPASLVRKDFRQYREGSSDEARAVAIKTKSRGYWWERD